MKVKEIMKNLFELQTLEFEGTVRAHNQERIADLRKTVPAPILAHYDRLGDQGKKGIAVLRNQTCSGCHMRVPLAVVMNLRHGEDVCLCDNCRRYLYLREETAPAPAPAPAPARVPASRKKEAVLQES
jgi:predicted  nucleic acid-binding Zn-ribbon protein